MFGPGGFGASAVGTSSSRGGSSSSSLGPAAAQTTAALPLNSREQHDDPRRGQPAAAAGDASNSAKRRRIEDNSSSEVDNSDLEHEEGRCDDFRDFLDGADERAEDLLSNFDFSEVGDAPAAEQEKQQAGEHQEAALAAEGGPRLPPAQAATPPPPGGFSHMQEEDNIRSRFRLAPDASCVEWRDCSRPWIRVAASDDQEQDLARGDSSAAPSASSSSSTTAVALATSGPGAANGSASGSAIKAGEQPRRVEQKKSKDHLSSFVFDDHPPDARDTLEYARHREMFPLRFGRALFDRLYPYQIEAVLWLTDLLRKGEGGILADDMGLGKTIMILSYLHVLKQSGKYLGAKVSHTGLHKYNASRPMREPGTREVLPEDRELSRVLIVAPLSVIPNWERECAKWCKNLFSPLTASNFPTAKKFADQVKNGFSSGICFAHYELLQNDGAFLALKQKVWDVVVFDEAHRLKTHASAARKACGTLRAYQKICLTGTPIQNRPDDLHSLLSLCSSTCDDEFETLAQFKERFGNAIRNGSFADADVDDVANKNAAARRLRAIMRPFLLRRTKEQILGRNGVVELPKKHEVVVFLPFGQGSAQEEMYRQLTESDDVKFTRKVTDRGELVQHVFANMTMLRKICLHPVLQLSSGERHYEDRSDMCDGGDDEVYSSTAFPDQSPAGLVHSSTKLGAIKKLVQLWRKTKQKFLIVSYSTAFLNLIETAVLRPQHFKWLRIDGSVKREDREGIIAKFQDDNDESQGMVMSVQVGGVGITLTKATRMVICDPWWNPAIDAQAVDRMYRIGQRREVVCYRLITRGTIEEHIFKLQTLKRGVARATIDGPKQRRYISTRDLKQLLVYREPQRNIGFGFIKKFSRVAEFPEKIAWGKLAYACDYLQLFVDDRNRAADGDADASSKPNPSSSAGSAGRAEGEHQQKQDRPQRGDPDYRGEEHHGEESESSRTSDDDDEMRGGGANGAYGYNAAGGGTGSHHQGHRGGTSAPGAGAADDNDNPENNDDTENDFGHDDEENEAADEQPRSAVSFHPWSGNGCRVYEITKQLADEWNKLAAEALEKDNLVERKDVVRKCLLVYHPDKNKNVGGSTGGAGAGDSDITISEETAQEVVKWVNEYRRTLLEIHAPEARSSSATEAG